MSSIDHYNGNRQAGANALNCIDNRLRRFLVQAGLDEFMFILAAAFGIFLSSFHSAITAAFRPGISEAPIGQLAHTIMQLYSGACGSAEI